MITFLTIFLSVLIVINIIALILLFKNQKILVVGIKAFDELIVKFIETNTEFFRKQSESFEYLNTVEEHYKKAVRDMNNLLKNSSTEFKNNNNKLKETTLKLDSSLKDNQQKLNVVISNIERKK